MVYYLLEIKIGGEVMERVSRVVLEDMARYNKNFNIKLYEEMNISEEEVHKIFSDWYAKNLPVDVTTWVRVNSPSEQMVYKEAFSNQIVFARDKLTRTFFKDFDDRINNPVMIISTHTSKSIKLPVYEINVKHLGLRLILRDNFHDWKISIESEKPLNYDFMGIIKEDEEINPIYCEGFDESWVYGSFKNNKNKFTIEIYDNYMLYTFMYLLNNYLEEANKVYEWM